MSNVDEEIYAYVTDTPPKSFLLFAGAGSGKTRTLVNALQKESKSSSNYFYKCCM